MLYLTICASLVAIFLAVARNYRPNAALGLTVAASLLAPAWLFWPLFASQNFTVTGAGIDVKVFVCSIAVGLFCFLPKRRFPWGMAPCDFSMIGLLLIHLISDSVNEGASMESLLKAYAEWYLPYIAARLVFQSVASGDQVWFGFALLGVILGIAGTIEAASSINIFEAIIGERPLEGISREASRWGLKRSFGPTMHPIYFGAVQLILAAWTSYAAFKAWRGKANKLWLAAPLISFIGIASTGSRSLVLAIGIALIGTAFAKFPKLRTALAILSVLVVGIVSINANKIVPLLEEWGGDKRSAIEIDGERTPNSSTLSRFNLVDLYKVALKRSGALGFGTKAVTGFPINVPVGPADAKTLRRVKYIDNEYVLLTLRFGYLGSICFLFSGVLALIQLAKVSDRGLSDSLAWYCSFQFGFILSAMVLLLTVWMPHEIGFPLVFCWGASSGLWVAQRKGWHD